MKTTVILPDALFIEAKKTAAESKVTLGSLLEDALRQYLRGKSNTSGQFKLADGSFKGKTGLVQGIDPTDWSAVRDLIYEGRGT